MKAKSEERIAELGKLFKGRIQTDWTKTSDAIGISRILLDEAYREPCDELMRLLRHRASVLACLLHQAAGQSVDRARKRRAC
jgi:hypothetical protein